MNLLAKNWLGLLTFASLFIFSCDDLSDIGQEIDPGALTSVTTFVELTLTAENVYNDSLRTSNTNRLLVGASQSPIYGSTSSTAIARLASGSTALAALDFDVQEVIETNPPGIRVDTLKWEYYVYDSVVMRLEYNYINTPDITAPQRISVHQLDDELVSNVFYLSKFDTPYLPNEPEDSFEFMIDKDSLEDALKNPADTPYYVLKKRLSNTLGEKLFNIVKNERTQENMITDFKGLALVPDAANNTMIGFNAGGASNVIVHYHIISRDKAGTETIATDSLGVIFSFSGANARYNKIETDRTGSLIGNNIGSNLQEFETGDNRVYLNPSSGIYPKISLEPLFEFFDQFDKERGEYVQISSAEMRIKPIPNTGDYNPQIPNFRFAYMNDGKQIYTPGILTGNLSSSVVVTDATYLAGLNSSAQAAVQANYLSDTLFDYRASMTFFVQQLQTGRYNIEKLALTPADINVTNQSAFETSDIKLRIYYALTN